MVTIENKLQIRSHSIISYKKFTGHSHFRTDRQKESAEKLKQEKTYSGKLKPGAKKRLIKAIELLVQSTNRTFITNPLTGKKMPFQLAFTTLTVHSPDENIDQKTAYKNLLAPFLQWLRRSHNTYLYIWKAELQTRGQIHYHLLLGNFVPHDELRTKWNSLQEKAGYLEAYFKDKGHYNAPSTEIKNALEHKDVAGYLIKEVAKGIQNVDSVGGKVWDCSQNLKEMTYFEADGNKYSHRLAMMAMGNEVHATYTDNCTIYKMNGVKPTEFFDRLDTYLYNEHITYVRSANIEKQLLKEKPKILLEPDNLPPKVLIPINWTLFSSS